MKKVVIVAPYFDIATKAWHPWLTQYLAPRLKEADLEVVVVEGDLATRDVVWEVFKSSEARALLGVGHGDEETFTGQYLTPIFSACKYPAEVVLDKCFAPVSCLVGQKLLPDMTLKGLGCGIGEVTLYWFYYDPRNPPLQDPYLALFTTAEFTFGEWLAYGAGAKQAYDIMIGAYYANARKIKDQDPEVAYVLVYDAVNRKFFGDPQWTITGEAPPPSPPPPPPPKEYKCPWCRVTSDDAQWMKTHIISYHAKFELKPCFLPFKIRKLLSCPLPG